VSVAFRDVTLSVLVVIQLTAGLYHILMCSTLHMQFVLSDVGRGTSFCGTIIGHVYYEFHSS